MNKKNYVSRSFVFKSCQQEHSDSGVCSQGRVCKERHPQKCRYCSRGKCWRKDTCVYLHKVEDFNKVTDEKESEIEEVYLGNDIDEKEDFNEETDEKESQFEDVYMNNDQDDNDQEHQTTETLTEELNNEITTDEILKMYENVELDIDEDDMISTEDILKMYDNDKSSDNDYSDYSVKKSTRKLKRKETL